VKLSRVAVFAAGYIVGARAGRERYTQIMEGLARASQRLEEFSTRRSPGRQDHGSRSDESSSPQAPV
jgi:hypothetical protein